MSQSGLILRRAALHLPALRMLCDTPQKSHRDRPRHLLDARFINSSPSFCFVQRRLSSRLNLTEMKQRLPPSLLPFALSLSLFPTLSAILTVIPTLNHRPRTKCRLHGLRGCRSVAEATIAPRAVHITLHGRLCAAVPAAAGPGVVRGQ
jgi:hypothetical protein